MRTLVGMTAAAAVDVAKLADSVNTELNLLARKSLVLGRHLSTNKQAERGREVCEGEEKRMQRRDEMRRMKGRINEKWRAEAALAALSLRFF